MGWVGGSVGHSPNPWGREFELELMRLGETTYKHEGEDLLHQIHIMTIETHFVNLHLHKLVRRRLNVLIALHAATLIFLLFRFG